MLKYACSLEAIAVAEFDRIFTHGVAEATGVYERAAEGGDRFVEVLVDCRDAVGLYTYAVPSNLQIQAGDILAVPFGMQIVGAIAIRTVAQLPPDLPFDRVKEVDSTIATSFFTPDYWQVLVRVATYYQTPLMQVIRTALPPGILVKSQRRIRLMFSEAELAQIESCLSHTARQLLDLLRQQEMKDYSWKFLQRKVKGAARGLRELVKYQIVESYLDICEPPQAKKQLFVLAIDGANEEDLTARQREILQFLHRAGGEMTVKDLTELAKTSKGTVEKIASKGYLAIQEREVLRQERSENTWGQAPPPMLTSDQTRALQQIESVDGYARCLLHGVTGSGKTEVYLQAIESVLARGQSALVLVPEIGLTPQLTDRFRSRFGDRVSVYHSRLSEGERYDTWRQMFVDMPQVVIGTRSAVFSPLSNLGLIVLDEEHDSSFKQDRPAPTYHAREVADWRAQAVNCPLILGSATPSLISWVGTREIEAFHQHYLSLPKRVENRPLPHIEIVDMRQELQSGNRTIFGRTLTKSLQTLKERQQQGILFVHRRGHSTFVSCRNCGFVMECPHCDVSLAYHQTNGLDSALMRCHYCNYCTTQPRHCPECNSPYFKYFGSGTQKVAQELQTHFPQLTYLRFDSDTTSRKGAHREILEKFARHEADILIGTQILAKGLDLPQVTFVGVIAADALLHFSDYQAAERGFQTLTQVSGRSGRGKEPGTVVIQTYTPEHPVIQAVAKHDYPGFVSRELTDRQELNYPPYGRLVLFRLNSLNELAVERESRRLYDRLQTDAEKYKYTILGPSPAVVPRVADRFRWQIMLKFPTDATFPDFSHFRQQEESGVNISIDIDPLNFH